MALWFFRLDDNGSFEPIPTARFERFFDGTDQLPASADGFLRTADLMVTVRNRRPIAANVYGFFKYRMLANGYIDPEHKEDGTHAWMAVVEGASATRAVDDNVIGAKQFANRYVDNQHRWKPTPAQLQQLAKAVNKKAKTRLL